MKTILLAALLALAIAGSAAFSQSTSLTLAREKNWLIIQGAHLPKGEVRINYLEAYCRANSTDADWHDTTIGHTTELISLSEDKRTMKLRCSVKDGVLVEHTITASADDISFAITAHNPTAQASGAHWAQPCIRLADFTGYDSKGKDLDDYLPKCFIFLEGKLTLMTDVRPWNKEARYIPGQVWCPKDVPRTDVNPRPLSPLVPGNGIIGVISGDEKMIFAVVFEPYQELFQGVARCVHSDFRIGGLKPGETKRIRGKIYIVPNDVPALQGITYDYYVRAFHRLGNQSAPTFTLWLQAQTGLTYVSLWKKQFQGTNGWDTANLTFTGDAADFDRDGVLNLWEYIQGKNSALADSSATSVPRPAIAKVGSSNYLELTYERQSNLPPGVVIKVQFSNDLITWPVQAVVEGGAVGSGISVTIGSIANSRRTIKVRQSAPIGSGAYKFMRPSAEQVAP